MIRQGLVQDRIHDLSTMNNALPPLNTLPQWSRVNVLDKARYPKPFVKDHKLNMDMQGNLKDGVADDDELLTVTEMNPSQRIQYLERSLFFLRNQHSDVLRSLHEEVESLKKENKELQFKIVMSQKAAQAMREEREREKDAKGETADGAEAEALSTESSFSKLLEEPEKSKSSDKNDEMKIVFLEEEIKELKHALREAKNKNTLLTQLLEQSEEQRKRQMGAYDALKYEMNQGGEGMTEVAEQIASGGSPVQSNGQPLTLQQCQAIIKHLKQVNEAQNHELDRLKLDLRDVLYSHKWTPDAYLMAKAYVAEDDRKEDEKGSSLPRIPLKNPTRKLPDIAYIRENVSLPALRQTVGNKAVERRKRTQVLQKAKLRPGALP